MLRTLPRLWVSLVLSLVLTVIGGVALISPASADPPGNSTGPWKITSKLSGKCAEVQYASTANSATVQQYSCGSPIPSHRRWWMSDRGDGSFFIINTKSEKCMNNQGGTRDDGNKIIQWPCEWNLNNGWIAYPEGSSGGKDWYSLVNANSRKCMDVRGGSTAEGVDLIQWSCFDGPSEAFMFTWSLA